MGLGSSQDAGQSTTGVSQTGEVCIPNISTRERRKRLISGVVAFAIGLVAAGTFSSVCRRRVWFLSMAR